MIRALIAGLLFSSVAFSGPVDAVVRVPSHGASATVVWTGPGRTFLLGCAHAYDRSGRAKATVIDAPSPTPGYASRGGFRVLAIDQRLDLSLIELGIGPLPYVCPVAAPGHRPGRIVSAGYDEMKTPITVRPATIIRVDPDTTWTREPPWHGRSGGALIDWDSGELIGVVSGYSCGGPGQRPQNGIYVSHAAVLSFLRKSGWSARPWVSEQVQPAPWANRQAPLCPGGT